MSGDALGQQSARPEPGARKVVALLLARARATRPGRRSLPWLPEHRLVTFDEGGRG